MEENYNDYNGKLLQAVRVNRKQYLNNSEMFMYQGPQMSRSTFGIARAMDKLYN